MGSNLKIHPLESAFFDTAHSATTAAWLGMAGVVINVRGNVVFIDPLIASRLENGKRISEEGFPLKYTNPVEAADVPRADAVLYTHADADHLGRETARLLAKQTGCRFYAPPPVARILEREGIPVERIQVVRENDRFEIGDAQITVTPAMHDWQETNPWKREDCCGYLLRSPDGSVWHPGDTRWIDDLLRFKEVDILFFDVAAVDSHLGPAGSARLAHSCGAKVMIAYHYGTFDLPPGSFASCDPRDALPYVQDLPGRLSIVNPGEPIRLPLT